jgi:hypothetical protein
VYKRALLAVDLPMILTLPAGGGAMEAVTSTNTWLNTLGYRASKGRHC